MVSCGGKTVPRWRTAAILKIDISPYLSEKSSDFHEILYIAANFELDERHVIKNGKVALDRLRVRQNVFLVLALRSFHVLVSCFFSYLNFNFFLFYMCIYVYIFDMGRFLFSRQKSQIESKRCSSAVKVIRMIP